MEKARKILSKIIAEIGHKIPSHIRNTRSLILNPNAQSGEKNEFDKFCLKKIELKKKDLVQKIILVQKKCWSKK